MDKHLCKVSINGESFFIFTNMPLRIDDLKGTSSDGEHAFDVCVTNGKDMFNGKVSVTDIKNMASQVDNEEDKFYNLLLQCLCNSTKHSPNQFTYEMIEIGESSFQFVWKQDIEDDMKFQLGAMVLHKEDKAAVKIVDIFEFLMLQLNVLRDEVNTLNNINLNLESEKTGMVNRLEGYVEAKETLEQELYTKFSLVLNEKKSRIRDLKEKCKNNPTPTSNTSPRKNVKNAPDKAHSSTSLDESKGRGHPSGRNAGWKSDSEESEEERSLINSRNIDTDEENERNTKMNISQNTAIIILESNIDDSKNDVPKKNRKRVRPSKPKTAAHSILPRTSSLPRPTKQSNETNASGTTNLKKKAITEEDLLDELMS